MASSDWVIGQAGEGRGFYFQGATGSHRHLISTLLERCREWGVETGIQGRGVEPHTPAWFRDDDHESSFHRLTTRTNTGRLAVEERAVLYVLAALAANGAPVVDYLHVQALEPPLNTVQHLVVDYAGLHKCLETARPTERALLSLAEGLQDRIQAAPASLLYQLHGQHVQLAYHAVSLRYSLSWHVVGEGIEALLTVPLSPEQNHETQ